MNRERPLSEQEEQRIYRWIVHGGADQADAEAYLQHQSWLQENPARQRKASQVDGVWNHPDFEKAVRLVASSTPAEAMLAAPAARRAGRRWPLTAAAGFLIAISITALLQPFGTGQDPDTQVYATERQQTRHTALADGSTLDLSAQSRVAVDYSERKRHIRLYDGEARFTVAKDRERPFVVESLQASIKALGTIFNVDQRGDVTELTVLEGLVSVHPHNQPGNTRHVAAGERVRIAGDAIGRVQKFDLHNYRDWLQGLVQVEDIRLEELLVEFNRYADTPVTAADSRTRNLRVGGTFDLQDMHSNLQILATLHGLEIAETGSGIVLRSGP
ncbi:FecR domain-containing protein [Microbulbifer elongatus]|uniref:FecR domain-containing protein n=1 Tax=Microbulbifer elongatus TaxID=86173 RepID=A0ABT1NZI2_9GAMM|nr:FecR domain-containing protein [Microbulbifer elongatus]MCQ3829285.1 FecR domain-containing protein [Microbulbifer elongatus]